MYRDAKIASCARGQSRAFFVPTSPLSEAINVVTRQFLRVPVHPLHQPTQDQRRFGLALWQGLAVLVPTWRASPQALPLQRARAGHFGQNVAALVAQNRGGAHR